MNDNQHLGTRVVTNLSGGSFNLNGQNASIVFTASSGTTAWTSTRHYVRTAGFGTRTIFNDAGSIIGSLNGTDRRNISYDVTIQSPFIKKFALGYARYFVAGTIQVTNSREKAILLDI